LFFVPDLGSEVGEFDADLGLNKDSLDTIKYTRAKMMIVLVIPQSTFPKAKIQK
jgi:hypothetical protein